MSPMSPITPPVGVMGDMGDMPRPRRNAPTRSRTWPNCFTTLKSGSGSGFGTRSAPGPNVPQPKRLLDPGTGRPRAPRPPTTGGVHNHAHDSHDVEIRAHP